MLIFLAEFYFDLWGIGVWVCCSFARKLHFKTSHRAIGKILRFVLFFNFDAIIHVYNQTKHLLISLQVKLRFSILFTAWGIDYKRALMSKTYRYMLVSWCGKGLNLKCYKNFSLKRRQYFLSEYVIILMFSLCENKHVSSWLSSHVIYKEQIKCCWYCIFFHRITNLIRIRVYFYMLFSNDCFNIFASMIFILVPNIISLTSKFNLGHCYSYHAYLHVYLYHIHVELCLTCQKETSLWSPKESERFRGSSNFVALLLSIFKSFALIKLYRQNSPTAIVITSSPMKCKST